MSGLATDLADRVIRSSTVGGMLRVPTPAFEVDMPTPPRRSRTRTLLALVPALVLGVVACSTGGGSTASPGTSAPPTSASSGAGSPAATPIDGTAAPSASESGAPSSGSGVAIDRPWATAALVDVASGQPFRIADLVAGGKVVFVETMAIWCTNCRAQQADAMTALGQLDRSKVAWIGLDVDPSESAEALAAYGPRWGFDFTYAVAGQDVSRALAADFGDLVLSPPSTPIVVIGTDGTITLTDYGHKSVDELVALAGVHGA